MSLLNIHCSQQRHTTADYTSSAHLTPNDRFKVGHLSENHVYILHNLLCQQLGCHILLALVSSHCSNTKTSWRYHKSQEKRFHKNRLCSCLQVIQALQRILTKTSAPAATPDQTKQRQAAADQPQHSLFHQRCCWPPSSSNHLAALQALAASQALTQLGIASASMPKSTMPNQRAQRPGYAPHPRLAIPNPTVNPRP